MPGAEPPLATLPGGAGAGSVAATTGRWPADFDAGEFVRHARLNFVRLQQAHDRKDLSAMRDFLTPELYRDIEADIRTAGEAPHQTEVVTLEADVLDLAEDAGSHLVKPVKGRAGWLVAGIQQA
jgi:predicted lipid-binding transport protein (Tim44 family)